MKTRSVRLLFMVWIAAVATSPLYAQSMGFQIGQSQPAQSAQIQNSQGTSGPILIAPMTSPIQPTGNPVLPLSQTIARQHTPTAAEIARGIGTGSITVLPAGGTVFVPAGTFIVEASPDMQQGVFISAPFAPASPQTPASPGTPKTPATPGAGRGGTSIDRTNGATNIGQQATPPDVTRLALGTTRDKVIEKYGNPIAFIMNMNGETLYFKNGVVVFIKDGVVAVPDASNGATRP
ncbi:MAG TPA: hypothetical protein VFO86_08985 [Terriglobia bacterium]|nr:hypothetical protein [Terriglobia bacterium]